MLLSRRPRLSSPSLVLGSGRDNHGAPVRASHAIHRRHARRGPVDISQRSSSASRGRAARSRSTTSSCRGPTGTPAEPPRTASRAFANTSWSTLTIRSPRSLRLRGTDRRVQRAFTAHRVAGVRRSPQSPPRAAVRPAAAMGRSSRSGTLQSNPTCHAISAELVT